MLTVLYSVLYYIYLELLYRDTMSLKIPHAKDTDTLEELVDTLYSNNEWSVLRLSMLLENKLSLGELNHLYSIIDIVLYRTALLPEIVLCSNEGLLALELAYPQIRVNRFSAEESMRLYSKNKLSLTRLQNADVVEAIALSKWESFKEVISIEVFRRRLQVAFNLTW